MKKVLSISIVVLLLLSLVGCSASPEGASGNEESPAVSDIPSQEPSQTPIGTDDPAQAVDYSDMTAFELYELSQSISNSVDSMEMTMVVDEAIIINGSNMGNIKVDGNMKMIKHSEQDIEMDMNMAMSGMVSTDMLIYYRDGYAYYDMLGQKMKIQMDVEQMMSQSNNMMNLMFNESAVRSSSVSKNGSDTVISFKLGGEGVTELMEKMMPNADALDLLETVGDIEFDVVIDKDMITKSVVFKFTVSASMMGETAMFEVTSKGDVTALNNVTITAPTGLDAYTLQANPLDGMI